MTGRVKSNDNIILTSKQSNKKIKNDSVLPTSNLVNKKSKIAMSKNAKINK